MAKIIQTKKLDESFRIIDSSYDSELKLNKERDLASSSSRDEKKNHPAINFIRPRDDHEFRLFVVARVEKNIHTQWNSHTIPLSRAIKT